MKNKPKSTRVVISKMPDKETLEQFINQFHGEKIEVMIDIEKGEFEWVNKRKKYGK